MALAASSGWKVVEGTKTATSLFGHIVAVPTAWPTDVIETRKRAKAGIGSEIFDTATKVSSWLGFLVIKCLKS